MRQRAERFAIVGSLGGKAGAEPVCQNKMYFLYKLISEDVVFIMFSYRGSRHQVGILFWFSASMRTDRAEKDLKKSFERSMGKAPLKLL